MAAAAAAGIDSPAIVPVAAAAAAGIDCPAIVPRAMATYTLTYLLDVLVVPATAILEVQATKFAVLPVTMAATAVREAHLTKFASQAEAVTVATQVAMQMNDDRPLLVTMAVTAVPEADTTKFAVAVLGPADPVVPGLPFAAAALVVAVKMMMAARMFGWEEPVAVAGVGILEVVPVVVIVALLPPTGSFGVLLSATVPLALRI